MITMKSLIEPNRKIIGNVPPQQDKRMVANQTINNENIIPKEITSELFPLWIAVCAAFKPFRGVK